MTAQNPATVRMQLQGVREGAKQITQKMEKIQDKLTEIEKSLPKPDQYVSQIGECMSGELRIWCVQYIKVPQPSLRDDLHKELAGLQSQLIKLRLREKNLARRVHKRNQADRQAREFKKTLEEVLKKSEIKGGIDGDEMAELLDQSEDVLNNYTNLLRANPSVENMKEVLKHMDIPMLLGGDLDGACEEAFRGLEKAANTLQSRAQQDFEKAPSVGNFDRMLRRTEMAMLFGEGELNLPEGFSSVNTTHNVVRGDSLSGISQHYYGKTIYWPQIYMANISTIGPDPEKLAVGMSLTIP